MIDKQDEKELKDLILRIDFSNFAINKDYKENYDNVKDDSVHNIIELIAASSFNTKEVLYNLLVHLLSLQQQIIDLKKKLGER